MTLKRTDYLIMQELDELLSKSTPYSLSSPSSGNPTLHDFVKGLILSTNIIDLIDKKIPNGFRVDWGQILNGNTLSKECDIIIYRGKPYYKEIENHSIRFVLVNKEQTRIVIQVKSSIRSVDTDIKNYCKELKKFVPNVWLIAEYCWATSDRRINQIKKELKNAGYNQFFYFCIKNDRTLKEEIVYKPFVKFFNLIKNIK